MATERRTKAVKALNTGAKRRLSDEHDAPNEDEGGNTHMSNDELKCGMCEEVARITKQPEKKTCCLVQPVLDRTLICVQHAIITLLDSGEIDEDGMFTYVATTGNVEYAALVHSVYQKGNDVFGGQHLFEYKCTGCQAPVTTPRAYYSHARACWQFLVKQGCAFLKSKEKDGDSKLMSFAERITSKLDSHPFETKLGFLMFLCRIILMKSGDSSVDASPCNGSIVSDITPGVVVCELCKHKPHECEFIGPSSVIFLLSCGVSSHSHPVCSKALIRVLLDHDLAYNVAAYCNGEIDTSCMSIPDTPGFIHLTTRSVSDSGGIDLKSIFGLSPKNRIFLGITEQHALALCISIIAERCGVEAEQILVSLDEKERAQERKRWMTFVQNAHDVYTSSRSTSFYAIVGDLLHLKSAPMLIRFIEECKTGNCTTRDALYAAVCRLLDKSETWNPFSSSSVLPPPIETVILHPQPSSSSVHPTWNNVSVSDASSLFDDLVDDEHKMKQIPFPIPPAPPQPSSHKSVSSNSRTSPSSSSSMPPPTSKIPRKLPAAYDPSAVRAALGK